jgi:exodeoxyribonuclease VII small subunit
MKKQSYEEAYEALQILIDSLDDASIDTMPAKIKEAEQLLQICKDKLHAADNAFQKAKHKLKDN